MSKLPRTEIAKVIAEKTMHVSHPRQLAQEVAAFLLIEKRTADLESILRDVQEYRAARGIVEVKATSAHPLTDKIRQDIRAKVTKLYPQSKNIMLDESVDKEVIGSVRLTLANQQLDDSIQTKLNHFKQVANGKV